MCIRRILLPLGGMSHAESALHAGGVIARMFDAHLAVLHVGTDMQEVGPLVGEGLSGAMVQEMIASALKESATRLHGVRGLFDKFVHDAGIPVVAVDSPLSPVGAHGLSASFIAHSGHTRSVVSFQARLSDIVVLRQPDPDGDVSSSDTLHAILFESGRGVVIVPPVAPPTIGKRICIGWNGTSEAASAIHHALPLLRRAEAVHILHSPAYQRPGPEARHVRSFLALHGIMTNIHEFGSDTRPVGEDMLATAHDLGADMMVMGAYSHSRLRQMILGGVTRHMLENSDIIVVMSR
ncbi:universal stress protein [Komagataeibacter intermedius]|uniref:Universal stress protein UspA n=3 Tax=Komagataeibacter intermedius TaxID=66229 RepID=A0A0N1FN57_9PROT|nr:universal stress protein [Komagataeibacter intermedius]KPH88431.1 universal stress protein UspA [Komagataeibacter intermedius AF2]MCF3635548.1 universal stress protein [Komagataeibacter intermedius]GAN87004.1 universal stress protein UspA [Komagataeibacter intermedius TF2]GBQ78855.1 universal stress protein UspA [Komagataeibacter intermedius NRIC 0521]